MGNKVVSGHMKKAHSSLESAQMLFNKCDMISKMPHSKIERR